MSRRHWTVVALLLLFGLAIRLIWVLKVSPEPPGGDSPEYLSGAERLLRGDPLPQKNYMLFVRAPGVSLFIAFVWKLVGSHSIAAIRVAQALISTATCGYIFALARLLSPRPLPALIALGVAVTYPYHIYYTSSVSSETLFAACIAASTYHLALGLTDSGPRYRHVIVAGFIFAVGNLVRPNLSTLFPLVGLWIIWRWRRSIATILRIGLALALPILVVTLPWTFAVQRQGFGWMWVTDGGGVWYYMGHNEQAREIYCSNASPDRIRELMRIDDFLQRPEYHEAQAAPPAHQQAVFFHRALEWDREHLSVLPCLMAHKFFGYWRPWVNPDTASRKTVLVSLMALPVLGLGLCGLWLAWRRGERILTVLVMLHIGAGTVVAVLASTEIRYRVPIVDVLLIPFAALVLASLWDGTTRTGRGRIAHA